MMRSFRKDRRVDINFSSETQNAQKRKIYNQSSNWHAVRRQWVTSIYCTKLIIFKLSWVHVELIGLTGHWIYRVDCVLIVVTDRQTDRLVDFSIVRFVISHTCAQCHDHGPFSRIHGSHDWSICFLISSSFPKYYSSLSVQKSLNLAAHSNKIHKNTGNSSLIWCYSVYKASLLAQRVVMIYVKRKQGTNQEAKGNKSYQVQAPQPINTRSKKYKKDNIAQVWFSPSQSRRAWRVRAPC